MRRRRPARPARPGARRASRSGTSESTTRPTSDAPRACHVDRTRSHREPAAQAPRGVRVTGRRLGHHDEVARVDRDLEHPGGLEREARVLPDPGEQTLPDRRTPLLVRAYGVALGVVVGVGDLRRAAVHDLPDPGAHVEHAVVVDVQGPGLRDQRLPDEAAADPERPEQVVERQALLGAAASGGTSGVVVLLVEAGLGAAHELQDARQVVVAGAPQVGLGHHVGGAVARVALLDGVDQPVGQGGHPSQHVTGQVAGDRHGEDV